MTEPQPQQPAEKPTLWQRIKTGFKTAISYIPTGIILTGIVFAGSAALHGAGLDLLGIHDASNPLLLKKFLGHLALGATISGVLGATLPPCQPCAAQGDAAPASNAPSKREEQEKGMTQQITEGITSMAKNGIQHAAAEVIAPGSGAAVNSALPLLTRTFSSSRPR